jgi:hypothetical protein
MLATVGRAARPALFTALLAPILTSPESYDNPSFLAKVRIESFQTANAG